jgi:hypothetical protein
VRLDGLTQEAVVASQRLSHGRWIRLPEPGAPFDVGEEEGEGGCAPALGSQLSALSEDNGTSWTRRLAAALAASLELRAASRLSPRLGLELTEEGRRLRVRLGVQLPVQLQAQLPIDQQRRGIVASCGQGLHQGSLRSFPQRVRRHGPAQVAFGLPHVSPRQRHARQAFQRSQVGFLAGLALLEGPGLGAALQQRAPVERDGSLQCGLVTLCDRLIEGEDVTLDVK